MSIQRPDTIAGRPVKAIHCVGVMGMGLGPLAIFLAGMGYRVSGEDDGDNPAMGAALAAGGVEMRSVGDLPGDVDLLAVSSAIPAHHPAARAASARGIPSLRRGELLAAVVRDRKLIAVCGSHGKTTTTALLITALKEAGFSAGYILGGLFNGDTLAPAAVGENEWVVAEVDESDGTIERFSPEVTVVVNLDWDHPDHYRREEDLVSAFARLFQRTRSMTLVPANCALSGRAAQGISPGRILRYGQGGEYARENWSAQADGLVLALRGMFPVQSALVRAQGEFNSMNATAALAAAHLAGAGLRGDELVKFAGVRRRQSLLSSISGYTVIEDYAHHPAEIGALLRSVRTRLSTGQRLVVVFQPHRYSRTVQFRSGFAEALAGADWVCLIDVYGAGESPIAGGTTGDLYAELRERFPHLALDYCGPHLDRLLANLTREVRPGDFIAWVGAGDIDQTARAWLRLLESKEAEARRWDDLADELRRHVSVDTRIHREEALASRTTMRVGGSARILVEPASEQDLKNVQVRVLAAQVPFHLLGRGSNLLVPDAGVDGVVVALTLPFWQKFEPLPDGRIWVGAGLRLKNLCGLAAKAGFAGFEFLEGIPGNVGGALRMNAGAMGGWTFNTVDSVRLLTRSGQIEDRKREMMDVDYRHCGDLDEAIALGAWLRAPAPASSGDVARQIEEYREKRQKSQPREPSAGCIFKNPPNDSAGRLIDVSGLKGERVGNAMVSPVHANFIVNLGEATSADVIELIRRVRTRVNQAQGVQLNPEVILFGRDWKDVL